MRTQYSFNKSNDFDWQVDVYAGAVFIQQAVGWNTYLSIFVLLAVTAAGWVPALLANCIICLLRFTLKEHKWEDRRDRLAIYCVKESLKRST